MLFKTLLNHSSAVLHCMWSLPRRYQFFGALVLYVAQNIVVKPCFYIACGSYLGESFSCCFCVERGSHLAGILFLLCMGHEHCRILLLFLKLYMGCTFQNPAFAVFILWNPYFTVFKFHVADTSRKSSYRYCLYTAVFTFYIAHTLWHFTFAVLTIYVAYTLQYLSSKVLHCIWLAPWRHLNAAF